MVNKLYTAYTNVIFETSEKKKICQCDRRTAGIVPFILDILGSINLSKEGREKKLDGIEPCSGG